MTRIELEQLAASYAVQYGLPVAGYVAQIAQESAFDVNAVSPVGAMGLAQFMPATWAEFGNNKDPFDANASLDAGARYMVWIRQWLRSQGLAGSYDQVLASYNWGIGNVKNSVTAYGDNWLSSAPLETRQYVEKLAPLYMPGQAPNSNRAALVVTALAITGLIAAGLL